MLLVKADPPVRRSSSYITLIRTRYSLLRTNAHPAQHARTHQLKHIARSSYLGGVSNLDILPATVGSFSYSEDLRYSHNSLHSSTSPSNTQTYTPAPRMLLPDDIAISERSRKFYNGTYTLTSDGFADEHGGAYTLVGLKGTKRVADDR
jgi:hypothetical protein